eukprot:589755_1
MIRSSVFRATCILGHENELAVLSKRTKGYFNELIDTRNQIDSANRENAKRLRGEGDVRTRIQMPKAINDDVRSLLQKSKTSHDTYRIIREHQKQIEHPGIYALAMQKCKKSSDWKSVHGIMELCLKSRVKPQVQQFNIFIDCMARSDAPEIAVEYFNLMIQKYDLVPTVITLASLTKSFRTQAKYREAEWHWNLMLCQHNVIPNELAYAEMFSVYAKAHQKKKANWLFHEYLQKVKRNELSANLALFGAYLNVLSRCGDPKGMKRVIALIKQNGFELNNVIITDIMRGFLAARKYRKCIETLNVWIGNGHIPTLPMMLLKCVSLEHMIKLDELAFSEKEKLYLEIVDIIHNQLTHYGIEINQSIAGTQLSAAVFLYRQTNPMKLVEIFEAMVQQKLVGYEQYDAQNKKRVIDLHVFQPWDAQFILRYLFGFKLKDVLGESDERLGIVCGKGKHTQGGGNNQGGLQQFVQNELGRWNPPIFVKQDKINKGMVWIQRSELTAYLEGDMNFAKEKLMNVSNDWYYGDPRKYKSQDHVTASLSHPDKFSFQIEHQ